MLVSTAAMAALAAGAACPVCALNDSAQSDAQWWVVLGALLVPFAVVGVAAMAIRRVLRTAEPPR